MARTEGSFTWICSFVYAGFDGGDERRRAVHTDVRVCVHVWCLCSVYACTMRLMPEYVCADVVPFEQRWAWFMILYIYALVHSPNGLHYGHRSVFGSCNRFMASKYSKLIICSQSQRTHKTTTKCFVSMNIL